MRQCRNRVERSSGNFQPGENIQHILRIKKIVTWELTADAADELVLRVATLDPPGVVAVASVAEAERDAQFPGIVDRLERAGGDAPVGVGDVLV